MLCSTRKRKAVEHPKVSNPWRVIRAGLRVHRPIASFIGHADPGNVANDIMQLKVHLGEGSRIWKRAIQ
jgi:hypothetical protein